MNRNEKIAWYNLAVISASILLFIAVFLSIKASFPLNLSLKISYSAFGLLGFLGLSQTLLKKKAVSDDEDVLFGDERDMLIQRRSQSFGFRAFWSILVFGVMLFWIYLRFISGGGFASGTMTISVDVEYFPMMIWPGVIILIAASSLSTILQYRSIAFGDNSEEMGAGPGRKTIAYTLTFLVCFVAFSIFLVSFVDWMFAVSFLMLTFAAAHLSIRALRYNPGGNFTRGDFRLLNIMELTARVLFSMFCLASITSTVLLYVESRMMSFILSRLVVLGFGILIFTLSILKYGRKPQMENRHE